MRARTTTRALAALVGAALLAVLAAPVAGAQTDPYGSTTTTAPGEVEASCALSRRQGQARRAGHRQGRRRVLRREGPDPLRRRAGRRGHRSRGPVAAQSASAPVAFGGAGARRPATADSTTVDVEFLVPKRRGGHAHRHRGGRHLHLLLQPARRVHRAGRLQRVAGPHRRRDRPRARRGRCAAPRGPDLRAAPRGAGVGARSSAEQTFSSVGALIPAAGDGSGPRSWQTGRVSAGLDARRRPAEGGLRRLRRLRARAARRPPDLPGPVRPAAPRPGVGRHGGQRRQPSSPS